ncbi:MAG: hypothetical protein WDW36_000511 [Sanguina aurantia]
MSAYGAYGAPAAYPSPYDPYAPQPYGYGPPPGAYPPGAYGAPAPGYAGQPGAYGAPAGTDEIRTIFLTGFPADVKDRELNNLLRFVPGYQAAQMNWKNGQAQGFALFDSAALAAAACQMVAMVHFDEGHVLRAEVARKNMFTKDDGGAPSAGAGAAAAGFKRPRTTPGAYSAPYGRWATPPVSNTGDNAPCSTLFVGNLSDQVSETELRGLFGSQQGFRTLKIAKGPKSTTAFVDFDDVPSSMAVHHALQGAVISSSSERGGLRIQYSKNPFGKRRD